MAKCQKIIILVHENKSKINNKNIQCLKEAAQQSKHRNAFWVEINMAARRLPVDYCTV